MTNNYSIPSSIKVEGIKEKFKNMCDKGTPEKFEDLPYFSNLGVDHVQGYTQHQNPSSKDVYYIFTHNKKTSDKGSIILSKGIKR